MAYAKKTKQKTCKVCKKKFTPERPMQTTCGFSCAMQHANKKRSSNERKQRQEARKKFYATSIPELHKKAQKAFNSYIRARDFGRPCITCGYEWKIVDGKEVGRQPHASHYRPVGNCGSVRYDERNVWRSCSICNTYKSGSLDTYRTFLQKEIGEDELERLEKEANIPKKWTAEELQEIIRKYRQKYKELV